MIVSVDPMNITVALGLHFLVSGSYVDTSVIRGPPFTVATLWLFGLVVAHSGS